MSSWIESSIRLLSALYREYSGAEGAGAFIPDYTLGYPRRRRLLQDAKCKRNGQHEIAQPKDWRDIFDRCFENREADIGRFLRRHSGSPPMGFYRLAQNHM
jgi:hypothetical protein